MKRIYRIVKKIVQTDFRYVKTKRIVFDVKNAKTAVIGCSKRVK